jgi:hypothetical protein
VSDEPKIEKVVTIPADGIKRGVEIKPPPVEEPSAQKPPVKDPKQ